MSRSRWDGIAAAQSVRPGFSVSVETITPEIATDWLERNKVNRPVSQITVNKYQADLLSGNWDFNHQGVAFDKFGNLVDGQHRLWAIVLSGVTVQVTVFRGVESVKGIDRGRSRSIRDRIAIAFNGKAPTATQARVCQLCSMALPLVVETVWKLHSSVICECASGAKTPADRLAAAGLVICKIDGKSASYANAHREASRFSGRVTGDSVRAVALAAQIAEAAQ